MIDPRLYSVRMRASAGNRHVSGSERLVGRARLDAVVSGLMTRALGREVDPDQVVITVDAVRSADVRKLRALDLLSHSLPDVASCREAACRVLSSAGVSPEATTAAFRAIDAGPLPQGGAMRGAMLMDALTGERREPDQDRGVRVSRFDWSEDASEEIGRLLAGIGLTHFRTREALALATKVAHAPGVIAELCWSDERDYAAGYAASPEAGYHRFPHMKREGIDVGGRVFFVSPEGFDRDACLRYLQYEPVLITAAGTCRIAEQ